MLTASDTLHHPPEHVTEYMYSVTRSILSTLELSHEEFTNTNNNEVKLVIADGQRANSSEPETQYKYYMYYMYYM